MLTAARVSALPVLADDGRVVGVVSEADLLYKLEFSGAEPHVHLLARRRRRAGRVKAEADYAAELMTGPAVVVHPAESVAAAAKLMDSERVKRLPVVNNQGRLVGIVVALGSATRLSARRRRHPRRDRRRHAHRYSVDRSGDVTVTVEQGMVTVAGTVEERSTVALLVRMAGNVSGVVDVIDHLTYRFDDTAEAYHEGVVGVL